MSGEVFVMKTGGFASLFTVIEVTYPSGSICTCGGKAAKDTSGHALFPVKAGTYTVECHTSDNSKSKSTSITVAESDKGKCKSVTLSYELVLFDKDSGIDRTDITGGWSKYRDGYIGYYDKNDASGGRGCMCKTAIDMTPYTKLVIKTGAIIYDISANGGLYPSYNGNEYVNLSPKISLSSNSTLALDISKVNSAMYIGFNTGIHGSYYAVDQILVSHVHLE